MESQKEKDKKSLRVEILEKLSQLVTTGFGLVAALAWNDVIKEFFNSLFPKPEDNLWAMFGYAVVVTILIVLVTLQISRLIDISKKKLDKAKKQDE